jgi:hypothetical protein
MGWGWKRTAYDMVVRNGRPVTALMFCIAGLFNISYETFYYIQYWLGMLFLETSIYIINNTLKEYIKNENKRILISYISVANIFMLEYFAFIEISGFMIAILLNCIAVSKFEHYFKTDKKCKKDIILSTILIIIAIFTYQGTLALFVMLSTPFALRYSNNLKEKLVNILWIFVPYIISGITCLITVKYILGSSRFADINMGSMVYLAILKIQYSILSAVKSLITTFDILPCGVYLVIVSVVIICSISMCNHYNEKEKYNKY